MGRRVTYRSKRPYRKKTPKRVHRKYKYGRAAASRAIALRLLAMRRMGPLAGIYSAKRYLSYYR